MPEQRRNAQNDSSAGAAGSSNADIPGSTSDGNNAEGLNNAAQGQPVPNSTGMEIDPPAWTTSGTAANPTRFVKSLGRFAG